MIVRMGILRKKENLSLDEFRKYWIENHGPLASKIPGLIKYTQNHVVNSSQMGIDYDRGNIIVDGFSQLWFEDEQDMELMLTSEIGNLLSNDEEKFIDDLKIIVAKQNVVKTRSKEKSLIKRMSILKRRSDIDFATFQYEWNKVHAEHVLTMPGIEGYVQNLVIDSSVKKGKVIENNGLGIDGIVELWFKDPASLENAFASPNGQRTMKHATTFIEEITTFLVEPHQIK